MQTSKYNNSFVSVIIPVYNVEKYLMRCIQSVLTQTYENYEVILVDDGSTDSSGKMCDDFARLDNRVHTFHKTNGGLSDARNFGVIRSKGEYVVFVDSDDYVSKDYVEYLVTLRKRYNVDIAVARFVSYTKDDYHFNQNADDEKCLTTEEALIAMMYKINFSVSANAKIYKKELVERHPYPVGSIYEDLATTYKIIADCKKIAYGDRKIYCYRQREGSITHQNISEEHLSGIVAAKEELRYMKKFFPSAVKAARFSVVYTIILLMDNVIYGTENNIYYFRYLRSELKPFFLTSLQDRNIKIRSKIRCIAIMAGYYPTFVLWKFIDWLQYFREKSLIEV